MCPFIVGACPLPASGDRDEWLDQLPTSGAPTRLPADRLAEVLDAVGAAVDALGGSFTARYTVAVTATAVAGN